MTLMKKRPSLKVTFFNFKAKFSTVLVNTKLLAINGLILYFGIKFTKALPVICILAFGWQPKRVAKRVSV